MYYNSFEAVPAQGMTGGTAAIPEAAEMLSFGNNYAFNQSSLGSSLDDLRDYMASISMEQLMQSDMLMNNISQELNISLENLTSLLSNGTFAGTATMSSIDERVPMSLLAMVTIFYSLIFVAGVLGNLITCIVISRNKFMHTATNFYLFNLAVSDLILLVSGVPQDLYNFWYPNSYSFTDVVCIMESVVAETAANATVLTITAFTVERYIAICHPFRQHTMSKLSRAIKFIFAIWMTALLLALPQAMQFSVMPQNGGTSCTMKNDFVAHVFAVSGFIFFGGPMTAICVLYVLIGMKLKRSRLLQAVPRRSFDVHRGISAQSRVVRMLVAVAVAFFLCWAPFHAQRLMAVYGSTADIKSKLFHEIFQILDCTSGVLYFLSTCINPLLYNIMSHKFRDAFKVTLARHFGLANHYQTQSHNYSALLRQNGSMRLHTTVNNNALLDHFNSYRVVQLQCRDPSHHLSLQDSIRTTTTTTTSSGVGGGGNNSCRSSHRNRCISIGSQPTGLVIAPPISKPDIFAAVANSSSTNRGANGSADQHRMLQTQISQLSSVGDANSLLEADIGGGGGGGGSHYTPPHASSVNAYRMTDKKRGGGRNSTSIGMRKHSATDADCLSLDSREWNGDGDRNSIEMSQRYSENFTETELFSKPVAPHIMTATMVATQPIQPMNSIAELSTGQPSRSRLKLSNIISRRDRDVFVPQSNPRVELMRTHLPGMGHIPITMTPGEYSSIGVAKPQICHVQEVSSVKATKMKADPRKSKKTLDTLTEKFRWRPRKKFTTVKESSPSSSSSIVVGSRSKSKQNESSSSTSSAGTPTPMTALMKLASCSAAETKESALDTELSVRNGGGSLRYTTSLTAAPKAL